MSAIYRILPDAEWQLARSAGEYRGSALDQRDGFIHLSAADQVAGTLRAHYLGQRGLVLLYVRPELLPVAALRWESSRQGALFPHLYAALPVAAVQRVEALAVGDDGVHVLPALDHT